MCRRGSSGARSLSVFKQRMCGLGIATLPNMIDARDGYTENGVELDTTIETVTDSGVVQRETIAPVRFSNCLLYISPSPRASTSSRITPLA